RAKPRPVSRDVPGARAHSESGTGVLLGAGPRQVHSVARRAVPRLPALPPGTPRSNRGSPHAARQRTAVRVEGGRGGAVRRYVAARSDQPRRGHPGGADRRRAETVAVLAVPRQQPRGVGDRTPHLRAGGGQESRSLIRGGAPWLSDHDDPAISASARPSHKRMPISRTIAV